MCAVRLASSLAVAFCCRVRGCMIECWPWQLHFDEGAMQKHSYVLQCQGRHVEEPHMVEINLNLHYGVPDNYPLTLRSVEPFQYYKVNSSSSS